jgi:hypothetical protein
LFVCSALRQCSQRTTCTLQAATPCHPLEEGCVHSSQLWQWCERRHFVHVFSNHWPQSQGLPHGPGSTLTNKSPVWMHPLLLLKSHTEYWNSNVNFWRKYQVQTSPVKSYVSKSSFIVRSGATRSYEFLLSTLL